MSGFKLFKRGSSSTRRSKRDKTKSQDASAGASGDTRRAAAAGKEEEAEGVVSSERIVETQLGKAEVQRAHTFAGLGLSKWLVTACRNMGLKRPTPVQAACVPAVLSGRDILACSPTGSGKTAAFALPILEDLSRDPYGVFAVVLTAGRELAQQITDQFAVLGRPMHIRVATVIGGMDFTKQARALASTPHVIVATPGRLADHISTGSTPMRLKKVRYVVVDEADRMLDASMAPDLDVIFAALPSGAKRHTLMFSATMTKNLEKIKALAARNPFEWSYDEAPTTVSKLSERYLVVSRPAKMSYLAHIMRTQGPLANVDEEEEATDEHGHRRARSCIVFVSTRYSAQLLMETLTELGIMCVSLHSALSQRRRLAALGKFKAGFVKVMVATDVASRGLDIPQVELVVNFDVPRNPDDYIHRVGRTARAGRGGRAITFVSQYDVELVLAIEAATGVKMKTVEGVDEEAVLAAMGKVTTARQMAKLRLAETGFEQKIADEKARNAEQREQQRAYMEGAEDGSDDSDSSDSDDAAAKAPARGKRTRPKHSFPAHTGAAAKRAGKRRRKE